MLQRLKAEPLTFRLLRWRWHDGTVFEPLLPYLKALKEKEPHFQLQHGPQHRGKGEPRQLQGRRWVCAMGCPQAGLSILALGHPVPTLPLISARGCGAKAAPTAWKWGGSWEHLPLQRGVGSFLSSS